MTMNAIETAMQKLDTARLLKSEAEALENSAKEILTPYLSSGVGKYTSTHTLGTAIYIKGGVTKRFDKNKASQRLAEKGVAVSVIQNAYQYATSETPRSGYVKYEPAKTNPANS
jgi:hypothetical protein